ncbi:transcription initiation factor TFIIF subunit beta [Pancytospora philotis]|nr:transcription initiation factor TFIIF subunit beta [Pancytospora philotis]
MRLDTANKGHTMWIAKMPKYLAEKIMLAADELTVGTLSIDRGPSSTTFGIQLADCFGEMAIPIEHIIDVRDRKQSMYIVKDTPDGFTVEGNVNKECFIRPVTNQRYLEYKRAQRVAEENAESVKVIDYFSEIRRGERYGSYREIDAQARKRKQMLQDKKRERLDKQDVYNMIFNAYERRELWTVKDLADYTGQPVAYIQELISDICVLNKKDHKNSYELKPEYKNN